MALLVIVCGALLMIGGAVSLLMGFDIVMTERGSAMTLGGTIALSGGLVAVGIGFALLRLSQILAVLERRGEKLPGRTLVPDRPVVPLGGVEAPPVTGVPPEKAQSGGGMLPAVLAAGAVSGAVAAGGMAWSRARDVETSSVESGLSAQGAGLTETSMEPVVSTGEIPIPVAVADVAPSASTGIADLEAELSRALAEPFAEPATGPSAMPPPDVLPDVSPNVLLPVEPQSKASFADGLAELLGKPGGRKRKRAAVDDAVIDDVAVDDPAVGYPGVGYPAVESAEVDHPTERVQHLEPVQPIEPEGLSGATVREVAEEEADISAGNRDGDGPADEAVVADDADLRAVAPVVLAEPQSGILPPHRIPAQSKVLTQSHILGTYNAGGRTYSMYADGSVQAVTESGVERFSSMEALRQHLAEQNKVQ